MGAPIVRGQKASVGMDEARHKKIKTRVLTRVTRVGTLDDIGGENTNGVDGLLFNRLDHAGGEKKRKRGVEDASSSRDLFFIAVLISGAAGYPKRLRPHKSPPNRISKKKNPAFDPFWNSWRNLSEP